MPHILIAAPAAWGLTKVECAQSLTANAYILGRAQIDGEPISLSTWFCEATNIVKARNTAVKRALDTPGVTHLVFVDADMDWDDPELFLKLLQADEDIVCGLYVQRYGNPMWCFKFDSSFPLVPNKKGLVEITHAPTGLMMIKVDLLRRLIDARPELKINFHRGIGDEGTYLLFHERPTKGWEDPQKDHIGMLMTDDFGFCETLHQTLPEVKIYGLVDQTVRHWWWTANQSNLANNLDHINEHLEEASKTA